MAVLGDKVDGLELLRSATPRAHRSWTPTARALAATGDHWTLLIVQQLSPGRMRLQRLRTRLPGVSTGVLERYVQQMVGLGLITRSRYKEMPPRVELELTEAGRELIPIAASLTRWGLRRMWSNARDGEYVDVDALLCLLPILLEERRGLPDGTLEAIAFDPDNEPTRHRFRVKRGRLALDESADPKTATARVEGEPPAWIRAFEPGGSPADLSISGDAKLASGVLEGLQADG